MEDLTGDWKKKSTANQPYKIGNVLQAGNIIFNTLMSKHYLHGA